jgi:3-deoxy-manno-octulosonate cytidylyltransferase (CMP-KDO synthetase)
MDPQLVLDDKLLDHMRAGRGGLSWVHGWVVGVGLYAEDRLPSAGRLGLQLKNQMAASLRMPRVAIIVPCRLESKRFPRKLLHKIKGKELLLWVAERIAAVAPEIDLWFAVDDPLLSGCLSPGGYRTVMTRVDHASGTDRIAEANLTVKADLVINVQADEPMVSAAQIRLLSELVRGPADMATLATRFRTATDFRNPNQVKVVCDLAGRARYFSRSPIPHPRDQAGGADDAWVSANPCLKHLGLYAYKARLLEDFAKLPVGTLEMIEKLEQLRVIENGREIAVGLTDDPSVGVDTIDDAVKFEALLSRSSG